MSSAIEFTEEGTLAEFLEGEMGGDMQALAREFIKLLKSRKSALYPVARDEPAHLHMKCEQSALDAQIHASLQREGDESTRETHIFVSDFRFR